MHFSNIVQVIDTHTYGEPTRVINGGLLKLKGKTVAEQRDFMAANYSWWRDAIIQEPRGHRDMFGALLLPPLRDDVDFGVIYMDNTNFLNMCGHATIGVATTIVEMGLVKAEGDYVDLTLETPAGLVYPRVNLENGRAKSVSFKNVPGFLEEKDVKIEVEGLGEITVDISFGGNYFAWVDISQTNELLHPSNGSKLKELARKIKSAVNDTVKVQHPTKPYINYIDIVTFYGKPSLYPEATYKNVHMFSDAQADRSPGGTGTTAMVSRMVGRGELQLNEEVICEGFVGGKFYGKALEKVDLNGKEAYITEITGSAFITGFNNLVIDPHDPFKHGFIVD